MHTLFSKCANAFLLLGKNDDNDPGMNVGLNLLCGTMIGIGGDFGMKVTSHYIA